MNRLIQRHLGTCEASLPLTILVVHPHPPPGLRDGSLHRGVVNFYLAAENLGRHVFSTGEDFATRRARMCRSTDAAALVV
jgi:hypothetical protein